VSSVTLPTLDNSGGTTAMHIFVDGHRLRHADRRRTVLLDHRRVRQRRHQRQLRPERRADFDGTGESFSSEALAVGTPTALTSGSQATIGGTTFTWPAAGRTTT
jgi:hypothetical protein